MPAEGASAAHQKTSAARRLLARLEVDAHVLATLLFRSWSMVAGGLTVLLIPFCLTPVQQGYYFTFASILALQVFFELGMGQVIVQIAAHESAHLNETDEGWYAGEDARLARVASLQQLLRRWYYAATALFAIFLNVMGALFFRGGELPWTQWGGPWCLLVLTTAGNLLLSWRIAIVEGFGLVREVNRTRLLQSMIGFVLMWLMLLAGAGLWAAGLVPAAAMLYSWYWLQRGRASGVLRSPPHIQPTPGLISWRTEIFPFQWRIAVSWISGFFIFQLFTPLIFKYHGAVEAGRVGLGITIFNSVTAVSTSWVAAKVPAIGQLLARGERREASALYRRLAAASFAVACSAAVMLVLADFGLHRLQIHFVDRLPSVAVLSCLAAGAIGNAFILPAALFMRAHKEEPLLASSVVLAVVTCLGVYFAAPVGAVWVVAVYAALVWLIGVPWTAWLLLSRYYFGPSRAAFT